VCVRMSKFVCVCVCVSVDVVGGFTLAAT